MARFAFTDAELDAALADWKQAQLKKNEALVQHHVDYMHGSIVAFLFSPEAARLRANTEPEPEQEKTPDENTGNPD